MAARRIRLVLTLSVLTHSMTDNYNVNRSSLVVHIVSREIMVITRKIEFSASHICRNPRLSEEENQKLFGPAANAHGHGHNYVVEVSLEGDPDPVTGMVLDLKEL